jgi:alpha-glucosidase (family GH31 glycosyl hydrolase)
LNRARSLLNVTARQQVWLPPGSWFNAVSGKVDTVTAKAGLNVTHGYTIGEVPMWFRAGAIIPYLPLKSLPSLVGVAVKQYHFLGFRVVPTASGSVATSQHQAAAAAAGESSTAAGESSTAVYEDNGATTAYLDGKSHVWTTCNATTNAAATATTVTIASVVAGGGTPYVLHCF